MEKGKWTTKKKLQIAYWGLFMLLLVLAFVFARQKGIYLGDSSGQTFYSLVKESETERIFRGKIHGETVELLQKGFFPEADEETITIQSNAQNSKQWSLKRNGSVANEAGSQRQKLLVSDGEELYEGTYSEAYPSAFYFDDWVKYMNGWTDTIYVGSGSPSSLEKRFVSEDYISCLLRTACGQTEIRGKDSLSMLLPVLLFGGLAYASLFHAADLFELRKSFAFGIRNREDMEPSGWYFFGQYLTGAFCLVMVGLCWLLLTGFLH